MRNVLFLLFVCSSHVTADIAFKYGLSVHNQDSADPEVNLETPLGILRLEYETEREHTVFCEHISSIEQHEIGRGFNHCGFLMKL